MPVFREIGWCEEWPAAVTRVVTGLKNFSLVSNDGVEVAVPTADTDAGSLSAAAFPFKVCLRSDAEVMVHGESVHLDFNELAALKQSLLREGHQKVEKSGPAADGQAQSEKVEPFQSPKRRMVEENVVRIGDQPEGGAEQPKKKSRKGCTYKKGVDREVQIEQLRHQNNERSIPRSHILQLVKEELEILGKEQNKSFRIESEAITLLHSTAEQLVVEIMSLYNRAAMQAKRTTVLAKDIASVRALSEVLSAHLSFVLREDAENCLKRISAKLPEESAQDVD